MKKLGQEVDILGLQDTDYLLPDGRFMCDY
jgi:hypothetical protein